MGKGKKRVGGGNERVVADSNVVDHGDTEDTNKPQADERDLEDLLKDIEEQYREEEASKKSRRKGKRKAKAEERLLGDEEEVPVVAESQAPPAVPDEKPNKSKKAAAKKSRGLVVKIEDTVPVMDRVINVDVSAIKKSGNVDGSAIKKSGNVDKKSGKRINKQVERMKEILAKQKELEEKLRLEEEERFRLEEERARRKEEEEQFEREKKLKKKEKEKERLKRKKESGQYLTKEQRLKKERALAQLESAGLLDDSRRPKKVIADRRQRKKELKFKNEVVELDEEVKTSLKIEEATEDDNQVPDVKDCWDDDSDDGEVKIEEDKVVALNAVKELKIESISDGDNSSIEESSSEEESDDDDETLRAIPAGYERAQARIAQRNARHRSLVGGNDWRSGVICVMGHVDTGKTKLLDNLRRSHVQDGEAGGITQQIGATNVPKETIAERIRHTVDRSFHLRVPGFLIIDTPGHESFKNLRSRGSSLCDIAVLIVDVMHGLEPQTIESIGLLKSRKCPFVVALNKIDRLIDWKTDPHKPIRELIYKGQASHTVKDFESRVDKVVVEMAQELLNVKLIWNREAGDDRDYIYMIPVSAITGDGIGDLLKTLVEICQDQSEFKNSSQWKTPPLGRKLLFSEELKCTVMEVKEIGGLGTTIDVCLVNGRLHHGDRIVLAGQEGPIVTNVRGLLMPAANKELRVKAQYQLYKEVKGARGVKIAAKNLDRALAGIPLYVAHRDDEVGVLCREIENLVQDVLSSIKLADVGVYVQASTLGSLEALLEFLHESHIPYAGINIGCVHRLDVTKASIMLQKDPKWAVILAFDVRVEKDAQEIADNVGVKIFTADIIYHLFDKFMAYNDELKTKNKEKHKGLAVFPCKLRIIPQFVFNSRDPIVVGVNVERGFLRIGTPLLAVKGEEESEDIVDIGTVTSMELNRKPVEVARQGHEVCIKIESPQGEAPKMIGRHFDTSDPLISKLTRDSINVLKEYFRDEMQKNDWHLIVELKKVLKIL